MKSRNDLNQFEIDNIIDDCQALTMSMVDETGMPYAVPMNFAYKNGYIYLHGAPMGKKMEVLKKNPNVVLSFFTGLALSKVNEDVACSYGMKYKSALLFGKVEFVDDFEEKKKLLNLIMEKYTSRVDFEYNAPAVNNVSVFKVNVEKYEGRAYGY
jgi:uncharacterized protein